MTCVSAELGRCQSTEDFLSARCGVLATPLTLYSPHPSSEVTYGSPEKDKVLITFSTLFRCVVLQAGSGVVSSGSSAESIRAAHPALAVAQGSCEP